MISWKTWILIFIFLISCQEGFQPVQYYLLTISTSRNIKLKSFALKIYDTLKMFLLSAWKVKQFLCYIEFICRRACENKVKSELHVFGCFPGLQNLDAFLEILTADQVFKSFSGWNNSLKPQLFLDLLIGFHMVCKNQESWEPWIDGFCV